MEKDHSHRNRQKQNGRNNKINLSVFHKTDQLAFFMTSIPLDITDSHTVQAVDQQT